jgi:hypothetical protein
MTNHYHLIVGLAEANLAAGMTIVNGAHARLFNKRHGRRGPVFEARCGDGAVARDAHLLETIRYVALNPVRAGLVATPQDWEWSTYAQLIGLRPPWPCFDPRVVVELFGSVEAVRQFVELVPGTSAPGTSCPGTPATP